jgi:ubiquinol-cytochrome c reductase cytochrome c1 subunit
MVRLIGIAAGAVFAFVLLIGAFAPREASTPDPLEPFHKEPKEVEWSWDGPLGLGVFGGYDRQQLQRGFQVYKEVCSACHSLHRVAFRNLEEIGFSEPEVKAIAKQWQTEVPSINPDTGEPATRPATPSDRIPLVYPNEVAARAANNNALPPDLSLITKAREDGSNYVHSVLTGYEEVPANFPEDRRPVAPLHYNPYFHSLAIAMPPPLTTDGQVTYAEGQPEPTVDQMAQDVAAFLTWAAEPKLESRRRAGVGTIVFLLILSTLAYMSYRKVWADLKKK